MESFEARKFNFDRELKGLLERYNFSFKVVIQPGNWLTRVLRNFIKAKTAILVIDTSEKVEVNQNK